MPPTFPPPPRKARIFGCMDDTVVAPNAPASAWAIGELERNANLAKARGGLMFRWMAHAGTQDADNPNPGSAHGFAWPFWHLAIPLPGLPVPKKPGLTKMRAAVRAIIDDDKTIEMQFAALGNGNNGELVETLPADQILSCEGTGAEVRYTTDTINVHADAGEVISVWARGVLDRDNDALMNEATYGGNNEGTAGTILWAAGMFWDNTVPTPWSGVAEGGHYILFISPADDRVVHVAVILGVIDETGNPGEALAFWPPGDPLSLPAFGLNYEIRKMIEVRTFSVVGYSVDAEPEE